MTTSRGGNQFSAGQVTELLDELDQRLKRRGVAASVFVVGGAAVAATGVREERLTEDVDAISRDRVVQEEAIAMAKERGIPENWLNPNATMWMPPLPAGVLDHLDAPGLRVTYADDPFLFATKLIAQRAKDADDVVALAERLGMGDATADELEAHMRRYYTDRANLEFILDGDDVDVEFRYLAQDAAGLLSRRR
ncbi:MAG: hypothetical protein ACR2FP_01615 [Nocardioidaceae bacterium]